MNTSDRTLLAAGEGVLGVSLNQTGLANGCFSQKNLKEWDWRTESGRTSLNLYVLPKPGFIALEYHKQNDRNKHKKRITFCFPEPFGNSLLLKEKSVQKRIYRGNRLRNRWSMLHMKVIFLHFLRPIISIVRNTVEMEEFDGNCVSLTKLDEM